MKPIKLILTPTRDRRLNEVIGLVLLVSSGLLFLALLSYRPTDPSLNSVGGYGSGRLAHNWVGVAGATTSDLLLQAEGIAVSLAVMIDPPQISPPVPLNIERCINIFLSKDVLGGSNIKTAKGYQGHFASFDLSQHDEVYHVNIDKMDGVHDQVMGKILQLATTPAKAAGEAVPLNYVVPPGTPIELWDSGMPVFARPGDTLQTIAGLYHVPLWSLTQVNKGVVESAPLVPGERVVVPRHLLPSAEVSGQPSAKH